jgi:cytochrome c peroxidase
LRDALVTLAIVAACTGLVFVWTSPGEPSQAALSTGDAASGHDMRSPIRPIPPSVALDARRIRLGRRLFHDPELSKDGSISCSSCHDLRLGGADGRMRPVGIGGQIGEVNTPTVLNSGLAFRQFWDGRARTLEEQIDGPLEHPAEMGASWEEVLARLSADPDYSADFAELYPQGITRENVKDAIATYERSLITPNSPFDAS